jgi:hypothetical protein
MDDDELFQAFVASTLPEEEWTHRAHLRVAWLHSSRYSLDEAHLLMRIGIVKLNASHGLVETTERGYHETLTRVWLAIVRALMKEVPAATSGAFVDACSDRLGKQAVLRYYSRERLLGVEARARFVDPDVAPLPSE